MTRWLICLCAALWASASTAACRQALVLGLDVSGSVDAVDYRLQLDGLANALLHPEVQAALLAMPSAPVRLTVFEWSGPTDQRLIADWIEIASAADIAALSARVRATQRGGGDPSTAIGAATLYGAALLSAQTGCWKRTLDLSGDGKSNTGPHPRGATSQSLGGITVNGLVIAAMDRDLPEIGELNAYYNAYVKKGPDAFVESALGFQDFEAAMVRKLKRELMGLVVSQR
ncbi:DUF1194 domain-containing protein [Aestuariicoccus sp. MJ-SS9]|uniref:DUF1194 domain-containing protein n=1 Tax=Aestuariicoccus sp. MJ-SS9 TaxID=3079855 RepID=UPI00290F25B0|nr:DUF1194 domain-containing protein [Aestuariicoccus sp. MJ-SS9]MDU8912412.1 DUF1194 domain-containing protein [Aestuariicoccus sp. MJ-SS9]